MMCHNGSDNVDVDDDDDDDDDDVVTEVLKE